MLKAPRADGTFITLPNELTLMTLEQLVSCADVTADSVGRKGRYTEKSGLWHVLESRLVCRRFDGLIRPLALQHILVKEVHGYLDADCWPGEIEIEHHAAPFLQVQQMVSHNDQVPFFDRIRSLTFDLGDPHLRHAPSAEFAATSVKFLLSLGPTLKNLVFAIPPGNHSTSSFREAVELHGAKATSTLLNVKTVALGRLCEFVLALCPNVERIVSYGRFMDYVTHHGIDHWELLVEAASKCLKLAAFEMVAPWDAEMLIWVAGKLPGLRTLGVQGEMTDHVPITRFFEFNYLLRQMPNLESLILPKDTAYDLFTLRHDWHQPGPYHSASMLALTHKQWTSRFADAANLHHASTPIGRKTKHIMQSYQYAYSVIAAHVNRLCPQVKTIWLDFSERSRPKYSSYNHTRDLRIQIAHSGSSEDDLQVEASWDHLRALPFDGKALIAHDFNPFEWCWHRT